MAILSTLLLPLLEWALPIVIKYGAEQARLLDMKLALEEALKANAGDEKSLTDAKTTKEQKDATSKLAQDGF